MIPERLANDQMSLHRGGIASPDRLPGRSRVVIVGGGIAGSSVAYHLAHLGWTDVLVLEQGKLTSGTTWHAAGLVAQARGTHPLTGLSRINASLYESLPAETGIETGLRRCGSLAVARTPERMQELLYGVSVARDFEIPVEVLSRAEASELWPSADMSDVVGATYFPTDATVNPGDAALSLAKGASDLGVRFAEGVTVTGFQIEDRTVKGVRTEHGPVECEVVVDAAGLWGSEVGRLAGVSLALYPAEHVWVRTAETPDALESLPILRDLDGYFYIRHYRGAYIVGAFEPKGKPRAPRDVGENGFRQFGPDWDHFAPVLAKARERLPVLREISFEHYLRAPESFTPDSNFHLGQAPELRGFFVACGFNSQGIIFSPGAGKALAEWIVEGRPTMDLAEVDVSRTGSWANDRSWLHSRTAESLGRLYAMHWPGLQPLTGRGVRRMPLHERLAAAGAAFGDAGGWERPAWYEPGATSEPMWRYGFDRPGWHEAVGEEVRATRETVALYDLSTYSKFLVQGEGAAAWLDLLCASDVDVEPGGIVYTTILNEQAGIEMDPTVTRLSHDRFLVLAPTLAQRRTEWLLRNGCPADVTVTDTTGGLATIHLAGPGSRDLLGRVTDEGLSNDAFPFLSAKEIEVGWARAWALRVSYTGELGWELYVSTEFASDLYEKIVSVGRDLGLRHAGAFAFDACRLERGFRSWGHDMGPVDDVFACGLGFTVGKGDFVGREAAERLRDEPARRHLVCIKLSEPETMLWHGESVLRGGNRVGHVSSGGYGYTLGAPVGLAWIGSDEPITAEWLEAEPLEVEVRDGRFGATASVTPLYSSPTARS